jgi:transcriptional regulator with XRE-family HTH domain
MSDSRLTARRPRRYGRPRAQEVDHRVAGRILERRRRLGLTTRWMADRLGLSLEQVRKIESGAQMVTPGELHAIADLLGVDVAYLFAGGSDGGAGARREHPAFGQLLADFVALQRNQRKALLSLSRALSGAEDAQDRQV